MRLLYAVFMPVLLDAMLAGLPLMHDGNAGQVVLNACQTAQPGHFLKRAGIPCVIAMSDRSCDHIRHFPRAHCRAGTAHGLCHLPRLPLRPYGAWGRT